MTRRSPWVGEAASQFVPKKRAAKDENDSPRRWFVYSRSLWVMKRPNHRRGNPANCSQKKRLSNLRDLYLMQTISGPTPLTTRARGTFGARIMKIGIHAPDQPPVVVSLLLAILALTGYFVNVRAAFWIAMFAYIVGALGVLVEI